MIWATVSSRTRFCWLYRFSIFGYKEYNQSDFGVDHLVMSMCRVFSCVAGRGYLLWPVSSLGKTLLAFSLLHSVLQGKKLPVTPGVSWLSIFAFQSPIMKSTSFWVLILERLVGLQRTIQLQLLQHYLSGYRLRLLWYWMICLGNKQRSCLSFLRLHPSTAFWTLVDYDDYSISSRDSCPQ